MTRRWLGAALVMIGLLVVLVAAWLVRGAEPLRVRGVVLGTNGPVSGAVVRFRSGSESTQTNNLGRFELVLPPDTEFDKTAYITAWSAGYLVGWSEDFSDPNNIPITLTPHYTTDNVDYNWFSHEGAPGSLSCSHCLACYDEWKADAHSQAAVNPRFLSLYNGTTLTGKTGSPTVYEFDAALGIDVPVSPSLGQNEVGPGFRLDFPDLGGNCASCHVPGAAARAGGAYQVDLTTVSGTDLEGVFCEFCHKVGDVTLDPATGLPNPAKPGVQSMRLYRPAGSEQIFFGNLDDIPKGRRVTYLPLIQESAFCASCHFGQFWGTTAYNSFGEWLDSPYSDPQTGKTCQDCHMPIVDYNYFVYPDKGGNYRDNTRLFSHQMPGATDRQLLQNTAEVQVTATREGDHLRVVVSVTNSGAGHHLPTDSPLRNVLLLVTAKDADGKTLALVDGPTIPEWGGVGDPQQGNYAGLPGVLYAKILADFYTGETPTYAYWRQTKLISDNRIPALATDTTEYVFTLSAAGPVTVDTQLLLRRAFQELMTLKNWNTPDMFMEQVTVKVE
ncbi:MAG TPA: hypothetical protein VHO69_14870 [Phototrophicaceae bacterium]|nr:hypothetical protein [Phototrophicaceae bacterium]